MKIAQELLNHPVTAHTPLDREFQRYPALIMDAIHDRLTFRPAPPGDDRAATPLRLPAQTIAIDATSEELGVVVAALKSGALTKREAEAALQFVRAEDMAGQMLAGVTAVNVGSWQESLNLDHELAGLSLLAVSLIDRLQKSLLQVEPLTAVTFQLSLRAKIVLAIGWEATLKRGQFPLRPSGAQRFLELRRNPCGALHFVSASDLDGGYFYTMGIAQSPEAQALQTMDLGFGLDGALILPGQEVSPIPPYLAMATRLFAASIPTSANISEEVQSIPLRNFAHPAAMDDLAPVRGGIWKAPVRPAGPEDLATDLRRQLARYQQEQARKATGAAARLQGAEEFVLPPIAAMFDATGLTRREIVHAIGDACRCDSELHKNRKLVALYLNIEPVGCDRVGAIAAAADAAAEAGLRYVAVADDAEDSWLPNLLEYLTPEELNDVADYSDARGIIVADGRPVDPVYTAATAAQRIQSIYTTLSVDILKLGMWLCLDALTARKVWREILSNPHIPTRMLLMPVGIVEPWNAFCDNRNPSRTPRAILDPYEKIKFMIEEAEYLQMPALLADTRHKATWVLLGRRTPSEAPHPREKFLYGPNREPIGRAPESARPLLSWEQFMDCERRARRAGILLGQSGSVEMVQLFRIISETTYDAAKDGRNPATAVWTTGTERGLRTRAGQETAEAQAQGSAAVSPFLAVVNRGIESHAKVDGWLRFLGETGAPEPLRERLNEKRERIAALLESCIAAQTANDASYSSTFAEFRKAYLEYHSLIRDNFNPVRQRVAAHWSRKYAKAA